MWGASPAAQRCCPPGRLLQHPPHAHTHKVPVSLASPARALLSSHPSSSELPSALQALLQLKRSKLIHKIKEENVHVNMADAVAHAAAVVRQEQQPAVTVI